MTACKAAMIELRLPLPPEKEVRLVMFLSFVMLEPLLTSLSEEKFKNSRSFRSFPDLEEALPGKNEKGN